MIHVQLPGLSLEQLGNARLANAYAQVSINGQKLPRVIYKYVDAEHADGVAAGSIKLGTLAGYDDLENGRSDEFDGMYRAEMPESFVVSDPKTMGHLSSLGLTVPYGTSVSGSRLTSYCSPLAISCYSLVADSPSLKSAPKPQAVFEIARVAAYLHRLLRVVGRKEVAVGSVQYENRTPTNFDGPERIGAHPFYKRPYRQSDGYSYEAEQEFRVVLLRPETLLLTPYPPDRRLGRLLKRIA